MHTLSRQYPILSAAALCVAAAATSVPAWGQASSLSFISEPGDPIGQGQALTLTDVETARTGESRILVEASNADQWYFLILAAAEGEILKRGKYENVVRADGSELLAQPGLSFSGNNVGCESVDGRFEIDEIRFAAFGYVERLRAHFEQRCDGSQATLWGDVIIDNPPMPSEMKVRLRMEPQAVIDTQLGFAEARTYITITCEHPTGGRIFATLEQSSGDAGIARGQMFDRSRCGPESQRLVIPISSDDLPGFRPGQATLTVEVRMEDPNYSQFETDAEVIRRVTRKIQLRE